MLLYHADFNTTLAASIYFTCLGLFRSMLLLLGRRAIGLVDVCFCDSMLYESFGYVFSYDERTTASFSTMRLTFWSSRAY